MAKKKNTQEKKVVEITVKQLIEMLKKEPQDNVAVILNYSRCINMVYSNGLGYTFIGYNEELDKIE